MAKEKDLFPEQRVDPIGPPVKDEAKYILYERKLDKFNTIRKYVKITPCVCDICGLDLADLNKLGKYENLSPETQERLVAAVGEHKKVTHVAIKKIVLTESEMKERGTWL